MQHLIDLGLLVELATEEGFDFRDLAQVVVNTRHRDNILCLEPMKSSGKSHRVFWLRQRRSSIRNLRLHGAFRCALVAIASGKCGAQLFAEIGSYSGRGLGPPAQR